MRKTSSQRLPGTSGALAAPSTSKDEVGRGEDEGDQLNVPGEEFYAVERGINMATPTLLNENDCHDDCDNDDIDDCDDNDDDPDCTDDGGVSERIYQDRNAAQGGDSPTLGRPQVSPARLFTLGLGRAEASDLPPLSAVTADTDGTVFDNEPQVEPGTSKPGNRTMLSQIIGVRGSCLSVSPAQSDNGSDQADKESVQIMLRSTTYYDDERLPSQGSAPRPDNHQTYLNEDNTDRWSTSSWTSSIQGRASLEGPPDPIVLTSPGPLGQRRSQSPLASPSGHENSVERPSTAGTVANDLGGQDECRGGARHQHLFGEIYQKILDQSPDLARQGGWDTQRVTQLCLQEIDKGKYERLSKVSSPRKANQESDQNNASSPQSKSSRHKNYVQGHKHRASLNNAEDFAFTSPSIVDWIQVAAADSPTDESRDATPPESPATRQDTLTPKKAQHIGSSTGGLHIRLRSPTTSPSSRTARLRPPSHSPPPLPHLNQAIDEARAAQSPSMYEDDPTSSVFANRPFSPLRSREAKQTRHLSRIPSAPGSTEALVASSQDSVSALSSSFLGPHLGLEQSVQTVMGQRTSVLPEQKKIVHRKNVIKELVDTEVSFGWDMRVIDDIYKGTSSSCPDLTGDDIKIVFGNSAQIAKFSTDFLDALKKAAKSVYKIPNSQRFQSQRTSRAASASTVASDDQAKAEDNEAIDLEKDRGTYIGQAFKNNLGELETVYTAYLKNHDAANRRLHSLQKNDRVEIWLKECRHWAAGLTNAWDLDSLLVKPVQRLLKYPLLLTQLLEATPEDHPDRTAIKEAMHQLTELSIRINEMKKHSELVEQGLKKRNRKESDVRIGITKAIGRKTEKLRQNVGVSRVVEDREFAHIRERYSENLARLVLVREDVKNYITVARRSTQTFNELATSVDGWIDVSHTAFPERESKWRQYSMTVRELMAVAVPEHLGGIQKAVLDPMTDAAKMLEALLKDSKGLIQKRDMKALDYARYKNAKDRGERLEKKITDRMEEWEALNREAKGRMRKLICLTGDLAKGCLKSFVEIQSTWFMVWQRKLQPVIGSVSTDLAKISKEWQEDFDFYEAQALTLGICNGSLLAEAVNLLSFATPSTTFDGSNSPRQPSWNGREKRSLSITSDASPNASHEFSRDHSGNSVPSSSVDKSDNRPYALLTDRFRGRSMESSPSSVSDPARRHESMTALGNHNNHVVAANHGASTDRSSTSMEGGRCSTQSSSFPPRLSLEAPSPNFGTIKARSSASRPDIGPKFSSAEGGMASRSSGRFSPSFSSPRRSTIATGSSASENNNDITFSTPGAFPHTCDSPLAATPSTAASGSSVGMGVGVDVGDDPHSAHHDQRHRSIPVLFLAASVNEFNIDRSRREAGFPYLTYVTGEIFDVIAERGELWLARNQDDSEKVIGWIWNKHFAKLSDN